MNSVDFKVWQRTDRDGADCTLGRKPSDDDDDGDGVCDNAGVKILMMLTALDVQYYTLHVILVVLITSNFSSPELHQVVSLLLLLLLLLLL